MLRHLGGYSSLVLIGNVLPWNLKVDPYKYQFPPRDYKYEKIGLWTIACFYSKIQCSLWNKPATACNVGGLNTLVILRLTYDDIMQSYPTFSTSIQHKNLCTNLWADTMVLPFKFGTKYSASRSLQSISFQLSPYIQEVWLVLLPSSQFLYHFRTTRMTFQLKLYNLEAMNNNNNDTIGVSYSMKGQLFSVQWSFLVVMGPIWQVFRVLMLSNKDSCFSISKVLGKRYFWSYLSRFFVWGDFFFCWRSSKISIFFFGEEVKYYDFWLKVSL